MLRLKVIAPNQTAISTRDGKEVFFSYNTPVAAFIPGKGYVRTSQYFSTTTSKHINAWLGKGNGETVDQEVIENLL